jgi:hypothetical protein
MLVYLESECSVSLGSMIDHSPRRLKEKTWRADIGPPQEIPLVIGDQKVFSNYDPDVAF